MGFPKIQITNSNNVVISLDNYAFQNFKYTEDINMGFPTIEFGLQDNLNFLQRDGIYGDELIEVIDFTESFFKIENKQFKIKAIGSVGLYPKISSKQDVKIVCVDKIYDNIIKSSQSVYFKPGEKKIITDLIKKFLSINGIEESTTFKINIPVSTKPFKNNNLYIPYSKDALKVIRRLANYSISDNGNGGFVFFMNRDSLNFLPIYKLFESGNELNYNANKNDETFPFIRVTEENQLYKFNSVKLSTYNSFTNLLSGHEKRILGFNPNQSDYNFIKYNPDASYTQYDEYKESGKKVSQIKLDGDRIPFLKDFSKGNITTYYTPLDNIDSLKAFGDNLYYSQMFNYHLDIAMQAVTLCHNFKAGQVIFVEFSSNTYNRFDSLSGLWLLKSFDFIFPGNSINLRLTRMGSGDGKGVLPHEHYTII